MQLTKVSKRRQRGFTLTEMGLALAIVAILFAGVYLVMQRNQRKIDIKDNGTLVTETAANLQANFGRLNQYGTITTAIAVQSRTIPPELRDPGANTATNSYGGSITVVPSTLTATNDSASLSWGNVPSDHCMELAKFVRNVGRRITVAGSIVKPTDGSLNDATLATACESANRVQMVLDIGRTST